MEFVPLDLADEAAAGSLLALQRRAYRVEADLIGFDEIPPLVETLPQLQACRETFLAARLDGRLVGAVSWIRRGDTLDLHRLVVDPGFFRRGIGAELVRRAVAAEPDAARVIVRTGSANEPAKALYRRAGFAEVEEREVAPGVLVTLFEKSV